MELSRFLSSSINVEILYYDTWQWENSSPYKVEQFDSLIAAINARDVDDGDIVGLEVDDIGLSIHVCAF